MVALALSAHAATYNQATLKGTYSFLTNLTTANSGTNQFAMVGVLTADGAGNVTGSYTSISWDTVETGTLGGTYTVNSNGTGTLTFVSGSTAQFAINLTSVTAKVARVVQMLQTNDSNNEIISGSAVLQSTAAVSYSVASLKGSFTLQYNPWTANAGLAEDGGIAIFTFDGKGGVKASETVVYDGSVFSGSGTFTYTVNSNGTGTITSGGKGPSLAFAVNTVTGTKAKGLQFLDTNTSDGSGNLVITGSAVVQ